MTAPEYTFHRGIPALAHPPLDETPVYDQLVLERTANDPAARRLATAIVTDSDSRKWGLPWSRKWRG